MPLSLRQTFMSDIYTSAGKTNAVIIMQSKRLTMLERITETFACLFDMARTNC